MEKVTLDQSTKNIPYSTPEAYVKKLIEATEKFVRALRWKAAFYLNPKAKREEKETYGFNSRKTPPVIEEMKQFEEKMKNMISTIEFKRANNNFQRSLGKEIKQIKNDKKIFVKADKTTNYYKMEIDKYNQLLEKNIQKNYRKANAKTCENIRREEKKLVECIDLADRIETTAKREAFITLKDHKPNFQNNPACRLINPSKSELGKASKKILEKVITNIKSKSSLNLWKNTNEVIQWFKNLKKQQRTAFITFDIVDFYPSISEELLNEALKFAKTYETITTSETEIILHTKKTLLHNKNETWMKKSDSDSTFDVTMGSYDGAETCELVGLLLLTKIKEKLGQNVGLYRDDGLAALEDKPREIENKKKELCKLFHRYNLKITIEANKKSVNYLDVTLDLNNHQYKPYKKPNETPIYVNAKSNHPPSIIKTIPQGINKRLSNLSCNEKVFKEAATVYQEALQKSGYNHKLEYNPSINTKDNRKTRNRKITWFNPPYDGRVKTKVGKTFFKILSESFPKGHRLHKIFNKNTIKLSYSCMPNLKNIINSTNKKKSKIENQNEEKRTCNCTKREQCPLENQCLSSGIVYQATVTTKKNRETYTGITENQFKTRFANHKQSFKNEKYKNQTELSKYIWKLKEEKTDFDISWKIIQRAAAYNTASKKCNLCTTEKWMIMCKPYMATLNTRADMINNCRHKRKFLAANTT